MDDGEVALGVPDDDRLCVDPLSAACGGVPDVPESGVAGQGGDALGVEDVGDEAEFLVELGVAAVRRADPSRFLAAVLERVESQEGELGGVLDVADADDATLLAGTVVEEGEVDVGGAFHPASLMMPGMVPK